MRTPAFKKGMYSSVAATETTAHSGASGWIGQHNDCFLADPTDLGTYVDSSKAEYGWLANETKWIGSMGGETCAVNPPRSNCTTALAELALFHYTYLHVAYHADVVAAWKTDGCFNNISRSLGYQIALINFTFPSSAQAGETINVSFFVQNYGYAAPTYPRPVQLVLRRSNTSCELWKVTLGANTTTWAASSSTRVFSSFYLPPTLPPVLRFI